MSMALDHAKVFHGKDNKWYVIWRKWDIDYPRFQEADAEKSCAEFNAALDSLREPK